jgi:hypothetical protein
LVLCFPLAAVAGEPVWSLLLVCVARQGAVVHKIFLAGRALQDWETLAGRVAQPAVDMAVAEGLVRLAVQVLAQTVGPVVREQHPQLQELA